MRLTCGVRTRVVKKRRDSGGGRIMEKLFLTPGRSYNVQSKNGLVSINRISLWTHDFKCVCS